MPSRVWEFAICISSRSLFIDHLPVFGLRAILAFRPACLLRRACWPLSEFQGSYPHAKSPDLPKCAMTVLARRKLLSRRE
jgi:hypothetical protein